ncbi:MAG: hypothetical protein CMH53_07180 [Myxococcales bacterium]|nr:hypothetical protein [Myxococcales bacterium]
MNANFQGFIKHLVLIACAVGLSGCYTMHILSDDAASAGYPTMARTHYSAVNGLMDITGPIPLQQVCPAGWDRIDLEVTFVNSLLRSFTAGMISPQTFSVLCKSGAKFEGIHDDKGNVLVAVRVDHGAPTVPFGIR